MVLANPKYKYEYNVWPWPALLTFCTESCGGFQIHPLRAVWAGMLASWSRLGTAYTCERRSVLTLTGSNTHAHMHALLNQR